MHEITKKTLEMFREHEYETNFMEWYRRGDSNVSIAEVQAEYEYNKEHPTTAKDKVQFSEKVDRLMLRIFTDPWYFFNEVLTIPKEICAFGITDYYTGPHNGESGFPFTEPTIAAMLSYVNDFQITFGVDSLSQMSLWMASMFLYEVLCYELSANYNEDELPDTAKKRFQKYDELRYTGKDKAGYGNVMASAPVYFRLIPTFQGVTPRDGQIASYTNNNFKDVIILMLFLKDILVKKYPWFTYLDNLIYAFNNHYLLKCTSNCGNKPDEKCVAYHYLNEGPESAFIDHYQTKGFALGFIHNESLGNTLTCNLVPRIIHTVTIQDLLKVALQKEPKCTLMSFPMYQVTGDTIRPTDIRETYTKRVEIKFVND